MSINGQAERSGKAPQRQQQQRTGWGQGQSRQKEGVVQGHGQSHAFKRFHDDACHSDENAQQGSTSTGQQQNQGHRAQAGITTQTQGLQGNLPPGLRRGLGGFANSSTQRSQSGILPNTINSNLSKTNTTSRARNPITAPNTTNTAHHEAAGNVVSQEHASLGFTQAYALGFSIPTSKFNTEAFGTFVAPVSNMTSNTERNTITETAPAYDPEALDDDLELPVDIDDDFSLIDMSVEKDIHALATETEISNAERAFEDSNVSPSQIRKRQLDEGNTIDEAAQLKQRVAELEVQLKKKQEELQIESGKSSMLKDKLEDANKFNLELTEKYKAATVQHQNEKETLLEKHQKDLANANMNHQFEVQKYILDRPSAAMKNVVRSSQQVKPPQQSSTPTFPKSFSGFAPTQSPISTLPRNDEGFSLQNFAVTPKSPRKSRSFGMNQLLEKPRPFQVTGELPRPVRPTFGFSNDIPTQSEEEIIRDKLLADRRHSFGLRQLFNIDPDEERKCPLPGAVDTEKNAKLEQITTSCVNSLTDLIQSNNKLSRMEAFKSTGELLRVSVVERKLYHCVNALHVMFTLCFTYDDLLAELSGGTVPFLEDERLDPLTIIPSDKSIPSALAAIHYLFLSRIAVPSQATAAAPPPPPFPVMRREHRLEKDAEGLLDADMFQLLCLLARYQLETKAIGRCFLPLVRRRIYAEVLSLHLKQRHYETLNYVFDIIDIITRDVECARLFVGWSISQENWTEAFPYIDIITDFIDVNTGKNMDPMNKAIFRIKLKIFEILERAARVNLEQTKKIVYKTSLVKKVIYSIRNLVDLASEIQYLRVKGSVWQKTSNPTSDGCASGSGQKGAVKSHSFSSIAPKVESPGPSAAHGHSSYRGQVQAQGPIALTSAPSNPLQSSESIMTAGVESQFSLFPDNNYDFLYYKLSSLDTASEEGGLGSRLVSAFVSPQNKLFDFVLLLKLELEFILNIIRAFPDYSQYLSEKEPTEYRALAYAVSRIAVGGLGLSPQSEELASDILLDLMMDDEEERSYLKNVSDMYGVPHQEVE
ncbi:hypothetical protein BX616_006761 [Lobosporangium transversale]|uniref:Uncharacterized protein n=1 Tax=Lobosporangium transversale TaxID=64571 RepID=A0A1Y2GUW2_9FUNG|nr:hypothetical protein BCR41DRAFT_384698 [Lobosporangium transversale]KAF9918678.1 hypothetical protein BX616_006761 [Lobosporangium transversale]ORZ24880.1 hypothetical protein BCR41DRAFT_384698 [Lobosporangium transversale]|eukprot:XP_021883861.1 hypothetical protein BCR41DRAFT_384698 [Lobosporangium transversale]